LSPFKDGNELSATIPFICMGSVHRQSRGASGSTYRGTHGGPRARLLHPGSIANHLQPEEVTVLCFCLQSKLRLTRFKINRWCSTVKGRQAQPQVGLKTNFPFFFFLPVLELAGAQTHPMPPALTSLQALSLPLTLGFSQPDHSKAQTQASCFC
jgi:hypothetical protein